MANSYQLTTEDSPSHSCGTVGLSVGLQDMAVRVNNKDHTLITIFYACDQCPVIVVTP